jgi:hypothetical protein
LFVRTSLAQRRPERRSGLVEGATPDSDATLRKGHFAQELRLVRGSQLLSVGSSGLGLLGLIQVALGNCPASLSTHREIGGGETRGQRLGKDVKHFLVQPSPEEDFGLQNPKPPIPLLVPGPELFFRAGDMLLS